MVMLFLCRRYGRDSGVSEQDQDHEVNLWGRGFMVFLYVYESGQREHTEFRAVREEKMNHNQENEIIIEAAGLSKTYRRYKKKEGIRGSLTGLFKRESLSLGERMKMELMVALLHGPRVLFPDEPTIGLDAIASRQIRNFLQEINREKHTTILLTLHYVEDIRTLCERAMAVSPLFRLPFEQINPGSLPLVCMSLCIIGYGIRTGGLRPGGRQAANLLWMLLMAVLYYDMEVLMRSLSFYVLSTSRMDQLEEASLELCMKLPGTVLYGVYKLLFYCLLPYGLMATVPVRSLIGEVVLGRRSVGF